MAGDKVMSPPKSASGRGTTAVQAKSGIIEGPIASVSNLQPFNRGKGSKK